MTDTRLDVIHIAGKPRERGRQYGESARGEIRAFVDFLHSKMKAAKADHERLSQELQKYLPQIDAYSPNIGEEMRGIADGSGVSLEDVVLISLVEEHPGLKSLSVACTSFAATGRATADGATYQGQTWDIEADLCENADPFLLDATQDEGPRYLAYTYPGMMAGAGLNEHGISLSWNSLPALELQVGVPTHVIIQEVLRQETIGGALAAVLRAQRAGCFNFVITDEHEIYDVEATPSDVDIAHSGTFLVHANHYVSEKFKERQDWSKVGMETNASTIVRHDRMHRIVEDVCGSIDLETGLAFLRDHVNDPFGICRHYQPNQGEDQSVTCASWVMIPAKREWWIAQGPPCEGTFAEQYHAAVQAEPTAPL